MDAPTHCHSLGRAVVQAVRTAGAGASKKVWMDADLEPASHITGGSWFDPLPTLSRGRPLCLPPLQPPQTVLVLHVGPCRSTRHLLNHFHREQLCNEQLCNWSEHPSVATLVMRGRRASTRVYRPLCESQGALTG